MAHPITPRLLRKSLMALGVLATTLAGGAGVFLPRRLRPVRGRSAGPLPVRHRALRPRHHGGHVAHDLSPDASLTRGQAAVFAAKAFDQSAARAGRRAALGEWWTSAPHYNLGLGTSPVPYNPLGGIVCDGEDVWASSTNETHAGAVSRIHASDGRVLGTWPLDDAYALLVALGRVFVTQVGSSTGGLFAIDPSQPPSPPSSLIAPVAGGINSLAFDGSRIWAAGGGAILTVTPASATPWPVTTTTAVAQAFSVLFDGTNVWALTDTQPGTLVRLDATGNPLQTVIVGSNPRFATFDGANIWVPNLGSANVTVVQASTGAVLATLPLVVGAEKSLPWAATFDGQRVLVTDLFSRVSLFKAADLSPIATVDLGAGLGEPYQACNDGTHFFLAVLGPNAVGRF